VGTYSFVKNQNLRGNKSDMGKIKNLLGGNGHSGEEEKLI